MKAGVNEIGAHLERLDDEATATKRLEKAERDGGLTDTTRNACDNENARCRRNHRFHVLPRRQVWYVLRPGRSPGFRIVLLPAPSQLER
jgi:hypothetical protein